MIATGCFFLFEPPKILKVQIPLQSRALREISDQSTWDLVLRKLRGAQVKKYTLYISVVGVYYQKVASSPTLSWNLVWADPVQAAT